MRSLSAQLDRAKVGSAVKSRILRLNPNPIEGMRLRGWHRKETVRKMVHVAVMGRGEFLRRFGRGAWDLLPPSVIYKDGRRRRVSETAVEDRVWERVA